MRIEASPSRCFRLYWSGNKRFSLSLRTRLRPAGRRAGRRSQESLLVLVLRKRGISRPFAPRNDKPSELPPSCSSNAKNSDQFAHRSRRLLECGLFLRGELDLNNLLDASCPELHGNTDI